MFTGRNIQGGAHLQNQNYFFSESINMLLKIENGHKNLNNSHNYHDEMELYQGINKRNT